MPSFGLHVVREPGDSPVVEVSGELDIATAPLLMRELIDVAADHPAPAVICDLAQVELIDARGVRILLAAESALRAMGKRMSLAAVSTRVRSMLDWYRADAHVTPVTSRPSSRLGRPLNEREIAQRVTNLEDLLSSPSAVSSW